MSNRKEQKHEDNDDDSSLDTYQTVSTFATTPIRMGFPWGRDTTATNRFVAANNNNSNVKRSLVEDEMLLKDDREHSRSLHERSTKPWVDAKNDLLDNVRSFHDRSMKRFLKKNEDFHSPRIDHSNGVESDGRDVPPKSITCTISPNYSYEMFESNLALAIPEEDVRRVVKFCFATMAVVFREDNLDGCNMANTANMVNQPLIPASAARMLWSELLGGIECIREPSKSNKNEKKGRKNQYKAILSSNNDDAIIDDSISRAEIMAFLNKINSTDFKKDENRRSGKDPFLNFVRYMMVDAGLVDLFGNWDDYDEEDHDDDTKMEMSTLNDGDYNLEEDSDVNDNDEQLGALDFSGWKKRKKKRRRRMHYFQLRGDVNYRYGVFLSSLPIEEGGFGTLPATCGSIREHDTMNRWNDAIARSFRRKLESYLILDDPGTEASKDKNETNVDDNNIEDSWLKSVFNPFDDGTTWGLKMYPIHLTKAGHVVDAAKVLLMPRFFLARLCAMGATETAHRHKVDIDQLNRAFNMNIASAAARMMSSTLTGVYASLVDSEDKTYPQSSEWEALSSAGSLRVKGEREKGEVGRALHIIGSLLADIGTSKEAMEYFELALTYKIASHGPDHPTVARTHRHMGDKHLMVLSYDEAISCYVEALKIERLRDDSFGQKNVIGTLKQLGITYGKVEKYDKAVECYMELLKLKEENSNDKEKSEFFVALDELIHNHV